MPHLKSAKKRLRQSLKIRMHNRVIKKVLKNQIKKLLETLNTGTPAEIQQEYNTTAMRIDKAAARRIIHPNTAARKKSRFAKMVHARLNAPPAPAAEASN